MSFGLKDLLRITFDKLLIPKTFCRLRPQPFNSEDVNFDTVFALILPLHFF